MWECDLYEYRPESDEFAAVALWAREVTDADLAWVGNVLPVEQPARLSRPASKVEPRWSTRSTTPSWERTRELAMERWGEQSVLSVPLVFQDAVVGALMLIEKRGRREFGADDLRLLELLAVPAAVAVQNARLLRREARAEPPSAGPAGRRARHDLRFGTRASC